MLVPNGVPEVADDLSVENAGFAKYTARGVTVNAARETSLAAVRLEVKSVEQSVEVTAEAASPNS